MADRSQQRRPRRLARLGSAAFGLAAGLTALVGLMTLTPALAAADGVSTMAPVLRGQADQNAVQRGVLARTSAPRAARVTQPAQITTGRQRTSLGDTAVAGTNVPWVGRSSQTALRAPSVDASVVQAAHGLSELTTRHVSETLPYSSGGTMTADLSDPFVDDVLTLPSGPVPQARAVPPTTTSPAAVVSPSTRWAPGEPIPTPARSQTVTPNYSVPNTSLPNVIASPGTRDRSQSLARPDRVLPPELDQYPSLQRLLRNQFQTDDPQGVLVPPALTAGGTHPAFFNAPSGGSANARTGSQAGLYQVDEPDEGVEPDVQALYERVVDLYDGDERELIRQVRELEAQSVGEDVSQQGWKTVRGSGSRITWGGRVDTDWVNWINDDDFGGQSNYLEFRRLRLFAAGEGYGVLEYQLELEFSPDGEQEAPVGRTPGGTGVEIKDAFIGMRDIPLFGYVAVGHFRTPIGLDERTSTRFNPFMERSLATRLLPGRELGIAAFNQSPNQNYTCSYGLFFDDIDEATRAIVDDNQGLRFVSRLTWTPYYDELSDGRYVFHTGIGYSANRPRQRDIGLTTSRPVRFSGRGEINRSDRLIDTGNIDTDVYHLLNGELAWVNGPLSIQGEVTAASFDKTDGSDPTLYGAYAFASYFLTGESRPYDRRFGVFRRVRPFENFFMVPTYRGTQSGWGAWELAFRWSHLNFDEVNDQNLHDLTLALNWYWNPNTRLMFNWIHPMATNSPLSIEEDATGDIFGMRLQVDF